jgi:hypothetical protein
MLQPLLLLVAAPVSQLRLLCTSRVTMQALRVL